MLVVLLSTISFFLPASDSRRTESPAYQLIASIHTLYDSLGIPYEDEFGLKSQTDPVRIEEGNQETGTMILQKTISEGESVSGILVSSGLSRKEASELEKELSRSFPASGFAHGKTCEIETNPDGTFNCLSWRLDRFALLHLEKDHQTGVLSVWKENLQYEKKLATLTGTITTSFSGEMSKRNRPSLAREVSSLLSAKVDLSKRSLKGSSYRILYEELWIGKELIGTGKILAVEISSGTRRYDAYRFADTSGGSGYYDERGKALSNASLYRQPCNYERISSDFGYRRHPISRILHFHGGVDLAAPVGTPVRAIADGNVLFRGRKGGAGNMITIAHGGGMHTQYLHLSRFSARSDFGSKVQQGDIIGYVGSTGSSTGPHLDFRVIRNGILQNPLVTLRTPAPRRQLSPAELGGLLAKIDMYQSQLDNSLFRVASVSQRPTVLL
jgi:murein DD-endopeptidase MepM/ murein hydrolase activator NlpD